MTLKKPTQNILRGDYLHTFPDRIEEERLKLLNDAYGPNSLKMCLPYIQQDSSILELGSGTGEMTKLFCKELLSKGLYIGVDKDPIQIEKAKENASLKSIKPNTLTPKMHFIESNVLDLNSCENFKRVKPSEGFNLIYCRWLLCHILDEERIHLIQEISKLLAIDGVFICEEPHAESMTLIENNIPKKCAAVDRWLEMLNPLQENLGINLYFGKNTMTSEFRKAFDYLNNSFFFDILGEYAAELVGNQKMSLVHGLQTAKKALLQMANISEHELEDLIEEFKAIAENSQMKIRFYKNTFGMIKRIL